MEGQDIAIEWRWSDGIAERFPELAAELVRIKVDVIVATDNPAIAAAQKTTPTIPIAKPTTQRTSSTTGESDHIRCLSNDHAYKIEKADVSRRERIA